MDLEEGEVVLQEGRQDVWLQRTRGPSIVQRQVTLRRVTGARTFDHGLHREYSSDQPAAYFSARASSLASERDTISSPDPPGQPLSIPSDTTMCA